MKLEVNISKKYFLTILGVILVLAVSGIAYAYNSNPANPSVFGHSADEIEGLQQLIAANSGGGVPLGTIALFDDACPDDGTWTRYTALDNRFALGSSEAGLAADRQSAHTSSTGRTDTSGPRGVQQGNVNILYERSWWQVPYRKMVFCEKTSGGSVGGGVFTQVSNIGQPDFESAWTSIGGSSSGTIDHNLGTNDFLKFQIIIRDPNDPNNLIYHDGMIMDDVVFYAPPPGSQLFTYGLAFYASGDNQVKYDSQGQPLYWGFGRHTNLGTLDVKVRIWKVGSGTGSEEKDTICGGFEKIYSGGSLGPAQGYWGCITSGETCPTDYNAIQTSKISIDNAENTFLCVLDKVKI